MLVVTSSLAGGSHYLITGIWKAGNCDPQSRHLWMPWNAERLPSDVRESNFILLLSAAGCWEQWPFPRCSQAWFCLFFQSLTLFYSTGTEMAEQVTEQSCLQLSVANRVYVMYWTSSTRKKKKKQKKQNQI